MFKVVSFDLDGTIADTIPMCIKVFQNSISLYINHKLSEKEIIQTFELNEIVMIKAVAARDWESVIKDFYLEYEKLHEKVTEPFPYILELFNFLKEKNYSGIGYRKR